MEFLLHLVEVNLDFLVPIRPLEMLRRGSILMRSRTMIMQRRSLRLEPGETCWAGLAERSEGIRDL